MDQSSPFNTKRSSLALSLKNEFNRNKLIIYFVVITTLPVFLVDSSTYGTLRYDIYNYLDILSVVCYVSFMAWATYYYIYLLINKEKRPLKRFLKKMKTLFLPISKPVFFAIMIFTLNISFSSYTFIKSIIPEVMPYYLDLEFYHIDKWLHFGYSPWEITHYFFSSSYATLFINTLYNAWFFLMWGMILYFILYRKNDHLRNRFFITFMSSWTLLGNIMAIVLSSAGPAFMHYFEGVTLYSDLIALLKQQSTYLVSLELPPVWALGTQEMLLEKYINSENGIGIGISAMPSMHVTIAVLMALCGYELNKKLGYTLWMYAFFIQVGSVHLAWHYAIDGYIGAICVIILWYFVDWLLKRIAPQPTTS